MISWPCLASGPCPESIDSRGQRIFTPRTRPKTAAEAATFSLPGPDGQILATSPPSDLVFGTFSWSFPGKT